MPDLIRTSMHLELMDVYFSSQFKESHAAIPFIDFIRDFANLNRSLSTQVVEGGFLDMVVCLYAFTLIPQTVYVGKATIQVKTNTAEITSRNASFSACDSALKVLSKNHNVASEISRHPIHILWPNMLSNPFTRLYTMLVDHPSNRERRSVKHLSRAHILWRILIPGPVFQRLSGHEGITELFNVCCTVRQVRIESLQYF